MKRGAIILAAFAALLSAGYLFVRWTSELGGNRYNPYNPSDQTELLKIISSHQPLIVALEDHAQKHARYPADLEMLGPARGTTGNSEPHGKSSHHLVAYSVDDQGSSFGLYIKLGWDPCLEYESISREWRYSPGDGPQDFVIAQP